MGMIFAHDGKQHDRWRTQLARESSQPQPGRTLAQLAHALGATTRGGEVVRGDFELRN